MALPVIAVPWIIGGLSSALGAFGLKKGVDAKKRYSQAGHIKKTAEERLSLACESLENSRKETIEILVTLGKARLGVEATSMPRFVNVIEQVHAVNYKPIDIGTDGIRVEQPSIKDIRESVFQAGSLLQDGATALTTGVLAGIGASGLASTIGVAGTGTAISSLSGVAATNATLAWLGGGTLASGGFGMAGGTVILGGTVAGPLLAAMGYFLDRKAQNNLEAANEYLSDVERGLEQIESAHLVLDAIQRRTHEIGHAIAKLNERFVSLLDVTEAMVEDKSVELAQRRHKWDTASFPSRVWRWLTREKFVDPLDFNHFTDNEQKRYMSLTLIGYALYGLIKAKVLDDDGLVNEESREILEQSALLLNE